MRKLVAFIVIGALVSGQPFVASASDLTTRLTGYSKNQIALSSSQKTQIRKLVAIKSIESLTCVGVTKPKPTISEKKLAQDRARAACSWINQTPGLNKIKTLTSTETRSKNFGVVEVRLKTKVTQGSSPATTPAPSPTATPTPTPSPIVRPNSPFYNYRVDTAGRLERRGSLDTRWYSDSASTQGISEVRTKAFSAIKGAKADSGSASITWVIGEKVPKDMAAAYQSQMSEAINFFNFSGMKTPIETLVVSELDRELLREFWAPNINGAQTAARYERGLDAFNSNQEFRSVSGGAESRTKRATLVTSVGITFMIGSKHTQETHLLLEHVAHELTHTWQFFAFGQTNQDPARPGPNVMQLVPCHLTEGGANLLGAAVAAPYADWYSEATNVIVRRVIRDLGATPTSKADVVALLSRSESWSDCQAGYGVGHLAYEWLVAEYGLPKYLALHSEIIKVSSFDQALQGIYGFGKNDFYEKVSGHVLSEIQKVS